jgi:sRNA-binding protein
MGFEPLGGARALVAGTLAALVALVAAPAAAQMYKCVDANGLVSYLDSPRAGCKEVDIRGQPPISGSVEGKKENFSREEADFRRRQIDRERAEAKEQQAAAAQKQQCDRMRAEYARLDGARRILVKLQPNGDRVYLDDEDRRRQLADLRAKLSACP